MALSSISERASNGPFWRSYLPAPTGWSPPIASSMRCGAKRRPARENALWVYVSRLRAVLEPDDSEKQEPTVLVTHDHGYQVNVEEGMSDAQLFTDAARAGSSLLMTDPAAALERLEEALGLWRGRAFEDFEYEEFAQSEASQLNESRVDASEDRFDAYIRTGQPQRVIPELESHVTGHPLRERPVGQLMLALYRAGRQAEALRTYGRFRRTLGEELGADPSPELSRLEEQILLHDSRIQVRRPSRSGATTPGQVGENPFKGLRAFLEDDQSDFFGRDALVSDVVRKINEGSNLLTLVGPSGSGKSSVVRAGLVPALRKGSISGSDQWLVAQMVPGSHPFAELEAALLRSTLDAPDSLRDQLDGGDDTGLLRAVLRLLPSETSCLVLVVDQFEELFTLVDSEEIKQRFLDNLLTAVEDGRGRVKVMLTLRADFYGAPLAYAQFAQRLGESVVNVVPMAPEELEAAAQQPARRAGVQLEPALLVRLIGDVLGQPGALPLFQYSLRELFERRIGDELTIRTYDEMGGVNGALTRKAEDLFGELNEDQKEVARQLFLRLVAITGQDEWTRRRVAASEILSLGVDVEALQAVLAAFGDERLLTFDRDHVSGSPTVEVAHEALLEGWDRLGEWIIDARGDLRRRAGLAIAASEWVESEHDRDYLLTGSRLEGYATWAASSTLELARHEGSYLDASLARRDEEGEAESTRVAQEVSLQRSSRRRLWALVAAGVALAAALLAVFVVLPTPELPRVALVFEGGDGQGGWNDVLAKGIADAERLFDIEAESVVPVTDVGDTIRQIASSGTGLIIVNTFGIPNGELAVIASEYPATHFVIIEQDLLTEAENLTNFEIKEEEGAFVAGAAAALTSKTRIIGFVGGVQFEGIESFQAGYEAGARYVDPGITILSRYFGPMSEPFEVFDRPDLGYALAEGLYADGADVVMHAAGESGSGVFEAANDLSTADQHLWAIGVDSDQVLTVSPELREHLLTSATKRVDLAILYSVDAYLNGTLEGGNHVLQSNAEIESSLIGGGALTDIEDQLAVIEKGIADGSITPPGAVSGPPDFDFEPDMRVAVTFLGDRCVYEGPEEITWNDVVVIDYVNESTVVAEVGATEIYEPVTIETIRQQATSGFPDALREGSFLGASRVVPGGSTSLALVMGNYRLGINCRDDDSGAFYPAALIRSGPGAFDVAVDVSFDGETCSFSGDLALIADTVLFRYANKTQDRVVLAVLYAPDEPTFEDLLEEQSDPDPVGLAESLGREWVGFQIPDPLSTAGLHLELAPGTYTLACGSEFESELVDDVIRYGAVFTVSAP